ncbi:hypothetical protein K2X89_03780, partial [Myxococcota bacterium]|nr:hypothetical protein [Myxococcota bacterium]
MDQNDGQRDLMRTVPKRSGGKEHGRSARRIVRRLRRGGFAVLALFLIAVAAATPIQADEYDEKSSGHPLR